MCTIVRRCQIPRELSHIRVVISNYYGLSASEEMRRFCGDAVVCEVENRVPALSNNSRVYFSKDGAYYQICKWVKDTYFGYNVYRLVGEVR